MKEEGLRSFLWSKRWLVLTVSELQIFKNEVSQPLRREPVGLTISNLLRPPLFVNWLRLWMSSAWISNPSVSRWR